MRARVAVLAAVGAALLAAGALGWTALRGAPGGSAPSRPSGKDRPRTPAEREAEDVVDAARRGRLSAALAGAASFLASHEPSDLAGDPDLRSTFEEARVEAGLWGLREAETLAATGDAAAAAAVLAKAVLVLEGTAAGGEAAAAGSRVREALAARRAMEEERRRREAEERARKEREPAEQALAAARARAEAGEDEQAIRDLAAALRAAKDPEVRRLLAEEITALKKAIAESSDRRNLRRRADEALARGDYRRAREILQQLGGMGDGGDAGAAARDRERLAALKELEENDEPEALAALRKALRWLARQQAAEGSFSIPLVRDAQGAVQNEAQAKQAKFRVGITGLAALALLGHVRYDVRDEFEAPLAKSLAWLVGAQKGDGTFGTNGLYEHSIATLALVEADRLLHRNDLKPAAAKAILWLQDARASDGGWRYGFRPPMADVSVTGWALQALLHARAGGYELRERIVEDAFGYLDALTDFPTGGVRYDATKPNPSPSMTAVALFCRLRNAMGPKDEVVAKAAESLVAKVPGGKGWKSDCYFVFYASDAMSRLGGTYWKRWGPGLRKALLAGQVAEGDAAGSWRAGDDVRAGMAGDSATLFLCAMNALSLENFFEHRE